MHKLLYILIALPLLAGPALGNSYTWVAPPGRGQLEQDPTLIPKGKGFLFVPTMTGSLNEPSFLVVQGNKPVREASPGTGVLLSPGSYELLIGSGTDIQMTSRTVPIRENMTTLIKPFWSGLVINVIDEQRNAIDEAYELYWEDQQENYGIGFGVEEERGEAVKTWLLPPGVYSVVPVGQNISTTRKFSVRLEPGELVQRNLVFDADNNTFIGFYPPTLHSLFGQRVDSHWNTSWQLSGSTQLSTSQNAAGEDRSVISLASQVFGRSTYSSKRNFFSLRLLFEEGFTRQRGDNFRKAVDDFEVRATYIYRLSDRVGPYLRGVASTKLFENTAYFDDPSAIFVLDAAGNTTEVRQGVREFTLSPPLSPLDLREGVGLNLRLLRSLPLTLDMRVGLGARQSYVADTFDLSDNRTSVSKRRDHSDIGLEGVLILNSRLSRYLNLDSDFDILMPEPSTATWQFNWENRLRLLLSRFVNMDIVFDFKREQAPKRLQAQQRVLLRFVYLL